MNNKDKYFYNTPIFDSVVIKNDDYNDLVKESEYLNDVILRYIPAEVSRCISLTDLYRTSLLKQSEFKIVKAFVLGVKIGKKS